ncbi:DUF4238 domain-containing protein [Devosia sp. BK]|uniref:DUF4238 domain-containing protein n=1 Tax=Devosia sp. BK TaxID=2871706 RepID=UPI0029397840|nr:DUF4238 domain-containing protein [Devosia sp. BK]MDV3251988.1 DUF4238 domain-containing protein [Devosia sp. BK]
MPPVPKRHHFVPEFIVRNFRGPDGLVAFYDKENAGDGVVDRNPSKVFYRDHLYTKTDANGTRDVSQELAFSAVESDAAKVVQKVVLAARDGSLASLSPAEKYQWDIFFYDQWRRVPDMRTSLFSPDYLEELKASALSDFERDYRPMTDEERAHFSDHSVVERMNQYAMVGMLEKRSPMILDALRRRGLGVVRLEKSSKSFILGSRPVVKLTQPGQTSLDDPTVEMWMPVAPDVMIGMGKPGREDVMAYANDAWVRGFNMSVVSNSSQIVSCSAALIKSLLKPR